MAKPDNGVAEAQLELQIRITSLPSFDSPPSATFRELVRGEFAITTSGFPPLDPLRPPACRVTFTRNGNGTASVAGTPSTGSAGSYPVTVTASNAGAGEDRVGGAVAALAVGTVTQPLTITVAAAPTPTPTPTTQGPTSDPTDTTDPDTTDGIDTDDNSDSDSSTSPGDLASTGGPSAWVGIRGPPLGCRGGRLWAVSRRRGRHG